jgi:hypothetical protein
MPSAKQVRVIQDEAFLEKRRDLTTMEVLDVQCHILKPLPAGLDTIPLAATG